MKKMRQRWIAILCCVAMLVTGLYVSEPQKAEAAEASGTMSISFSNDYVGYLNVVYTLSGATTTGGPRFIGNGDTTFVDNYITFDGGMKREHFMTGSNFAYVANESVLQFNWQNDNATFQEGWSFTIAEGALIPIDSNGTYVALDKNYTFTFHADGKVGVEGYHLTTYSLPTENLIANFKSGGEHNYNFTFDNPSISFNGGGAMLTDDETYADYIFVEGFSFSDLEANDIKFKIYFGTGVGASSIFQFLSWGSIRTKMLKGDQIIFKKGMPLYFTDVNGDKWKGVLDATHVYECMYDYTVQSEHDQVFRGVKIDSTNVFGMNIETHTVTQNGESNYGFTWSAGDAQGTAEIENNILDNYVTQDYLDFYGCTREEIITNNSMKIFFIPHFNVMQIEVYDAKALDVGDQIVMKKGMPIVWNKGTDEHKALYAVLDNEYTFTVEANDGTNVTISCQILGSYGLSGRVTSGYDVGYEATPYFNLFFNAGEIPENESFSELFIESWDVLKDYFSISGYTSEQLQNNITLKRYNISALRGIRVVYTKSNIVFTEGTEMMFKKGLPISYLVNGKTKTIRLDKDYGFVYSNGAFTYDPTLGNQEEVQLPSFKFAVSEFGAVYEDVSTDTYVANIGYTSEEAIVSDNYQTFLLDDARTAEYINVFGMSTDELAALGIKVNFIPGAGVVQIRLGNTLEWLSEGLQVTFEEGMPIYYQSGGKEAVIQLEETFVYTISRVDTTTDKAHTATFVRYGESVEFALNTEGDMVTHLDCNLGVINPTSGEQDILDDMTDGYVWLDESLINNYIDFCGMTKEEVKQYGIRVALIRSGNTEVMQIKWGSVGGNLSVGQRLVLKTGLPFTYDTTDGMKRIITLNRDYIFEVKSVSGTSATLRYTNVLIGGTWGLLFGQEYGTAYGVNEGYYNNIFFSSCDLKEDMFNVQSISMAAIREYVEFGKIAPEKYETVRVDIIPVLNADNQLIQLRWGDATSQMQAGQEIVFKKGMPITATDGEGNQYLYTLDANYAFVLVGRDGEGAANGFVLTGMQKVSNFTKGDVDGDYMLNVNDIKLIRKQLVGLINKEVDFTDATQDGYTTSQDLVRALNEWSDTEPEIYTTIYENSFAPDNVAVGEEITYTINASVNDVNYIRLTFGTTENLYGTFVYETREGKIYEEVFYVSEEEVQFEQFFDYYRNLSPTANNSNAANAVLKSISFKNVGDAFAKVLLNEVEIAQREFISDDMLWVENGELKIGVDLNMGGSLGYMESTKYNPVERVGTNKVEIELGGTASRTETDYTNVNLINIRDLGRQIQQSYFIDVQDEEYVNVTYEVDGDEEEWPYNPVQAGDQYDNQSQIVDFRVLDADGDEEDDLIYIKVRAMDWAQNGLTTESYYENWYRLSGNLLYVDNNFVDWAGWQDPGKSQAQELPAVYLAQSLNYFVDGDDISSRTIWGDWADKDADNHFFEADSDMSSWYAWVNKNADDAFGVGILIPGVSQCTAGRPIETDSTSIFTTSLNSNAKSAAILGLDSNLYNSMYRHTKQNCFLGNTSYIAPGKVATLEEYRNYEYTYVLTADKLENMKGVFDSIEPQIANKNAAMKSWKYEE